MAEIKYPHFAAIDAFEHRFSAPVSVAKHVELMAFQVAKTRRVKAFSAFIPQSRGAPRLGKFMARVTSEKFEGKLNAHSGPELNGSRKALVRQPGVDEQRKIPDTDRSPAT